MSSSELMLCPQSQAELYSFHSFDGCRILYRHWPAENHNGRFITLFHRGHEHGARLTEMAQFYAQQGYHVFAWDARGNGESEGTRDSAESFSVLTHDAELWMRHLKQQHLLEFEQTSVIAMSIGAVIAAAWVHDYAPDIRALVLAAPAFRIKLYVPLAIPLLRIARKNGWIENLNSYVKARVLTHDRHEQQTFNQDPLISHSIATDLLIDTYDTSTRLVEDSGAIHTPTLMLCAEQDWVVKRRPQRQFYQGLSSPYKEWQSLPGFYHAIFHEDQRQQVFARSLDFIERAYARAPWTPELNQQDHYGPSKDKYDRLCMTAKHPGYWLAKQGMKLLGRISDGIHLGLKTGFDSGSTLDYIYQNQASGKGNFGRWVDEQYLDSIGWRGIRLRKANLDELLDTVTQTARNEKRPIQLLDIATGNGRYICDFLARHPDIEASAELRDYCPNNIAKVTALAEQMGLGEKVQAKQKDAFDLDSYEKQGNVDVAVISGVFELFSDNQPIQQALAGVAKQVKAGGVLIYTNQPWHPQQAFIAKVLGGHQGNDWVMRCRSQAEMDALVEEAGFEKMGMRIDRFGIFTVSVALRKDA
ncbi:putative protein YnbC [Vibrio stylophorae]|uniref:Alpha/beta fold hydrolase n=1 Tax=Vibrio stylophorae TaxID=659351 RepID=A0ABM8ZW34_9VIBR|nr:alpha/beta fold hydrolase [Vibrio stylophorae]CAH0534218.1 putative protein YnbC [Vibrio stylophorae]